MQDVKKAKPAELTVRQIREILADLEKEGGKNPHTVDLLFDQAVPAKALSLSTGLSMEELEGDVTPSELNSLLEDFKAANPFFVEMMGRIVKAGEAVLAQHKAADATSGRKT